jgi:hypothetical protein
VKLLTYPSSLNMDGMNGSNTVTRLQALHPIKLGRALGAAIYIDPAMSCKVLKENSQAMYWTSVRSLTLDEIQSPTEIAECLECDASVEEELG